MCVRIAAADRAQEVVYPVKMPSPRVIREIIAIRSSSGADLAACCKESQRIKMPRNDGALLGWYTHTGIEKL